MQVISAFSLMQTTSEYCDCKVQDSTVDEQTTSCDLMFQTKGERLHESDCTLTQASCNSSSQQKKVGKAPKTMKLGGSTLDLIVKK